jgi:hypothetical protein
MLVWHAFCKCRILGGLERWDLSVDGMAAEDVEAAAAAASTEVAHSDADHVGGDCNLAGARCS